MIGELCCHGRAPMQDPRRVLDLQATLRVTAIGEPHCEPTPPAVIPRRFGKGQRLAHLALIAQAAGSVMPLHDPRIDDCVAEQRQDMLQTRFAMHDPYLDSLNPAPFIMLFHLPRGPALWPAQLRPRWAAPVAGAGRRRAMAKGVHDG